MWIISALVALSLRSLVPNTRLEWAEVFCLGYFGSLDNLELNLLVLIQGPVAAAGDGSLVGENVGGIRNLSNQMRRSGGC
jgi:hypothetical protein